MIIINLFILLVFVIIIIKSRNYGTDFLFNLKEEQHKLKKYYSLGLYLIDNTPIYKLLSKSGKVEDSLKAIHVGEQIPEVKKLYYCKKIIIVVTVLLISDLLSLGYHIKAFGEKQLYNGHYIMRPDYEEGTKLFDLKVQMIEKDRVLIEEELTLEVEEKAYDHSTLDELFVQAKEYIDATFLLDNPLAEEVQSDLKFPNYLPGSKLTITWETGNETIIGRDGKVRNEELDESKLVWITAVISYGDRREEYTRYVQVLPKEYSKAESARRSLLNALQKTMDKNKEKELVSLPQAIGNLQIYWREKTDNAGTMFLLFGGVVATLLYISLDRDLYDRVDKRNRQMLLDYPEIINKFKLFVGAGMSISNAWHKIAKDYKEKVNSENVNKEKGIKKRYAYEEIMITYNEIMVGIPETTAYERFGRRVKLLPYLRFSSFIAQNVKKGTKDFLAQLELEASEAFEERKELAKRMGEEAGTKLLVPMMIMLIIVLAIIMVPAFLSFQI
jgi:hypothetical protein